MPRRRSSTHARTGRVAKTHAGVRSLFALLARRETDIAHDLPGVLARAYEFKEHADYRTAKMADVSAAQAETQITAARRFVGEVTRVLMAP